MANSLSLRCIIDVEASGFGPQSYPIELGVALSCGERLSVLIKPEPDWTSWDFEAEKLHGLSRELLNDIGKPIEEVVSTMNNVLEGQTLFSDGWVVDKPWIATLFNKAHTHMRFNVSPIEQIMREAQFELWDATKKQVIDDLGITRHRASQDAWIIQQTYARTCELSPHALSRSAYAQRASTQKIAV